MPPAASGADGEFAHEMRLRARQDGGAFLAIKMHPRKFNHFAGDVGKTFERVAGAAQRVGHTGGCGSRHRWSPPEGLMQGHKEPPPSKVIWSKVRFDIDQGPRGDLQRAQPSSAFIKQPCAP